MASTMTITHNPEGLSRGSTVKITKAKSPVTPSHFPAAAFEARFGFSPDALPRRTAADLREFAASELDLNLPIRIKKEDAVAMIAKAAAEFLSGLSDEELVREDEDEDDEEEAEG
jgi:hypothetical protein